MPTCKDCKWCAGIILPDMYICAALDEPEYVEEVFALDSDLECEFYVQKLDDNKTKKPSA